jgi:hypothetical protein
MSFNNVDTKLESALFAVVAAVQASLPGVLIKKGVDGTEIAEPCVIVECQGGEPDEQLGMMSVWRLRAAVYVRTSPDEHLSTSAVHESRVGVVHDALITDTIESDLSSAVSDFFVFGDSATGQPGVILEGRTQEIRDRGWGSVLNLVVACCGSDVG